MTDSNGFNTGHWISTKYIISIIKLSNSSGDHSMLLVYVRTRMECTDIEMQGDGRK